MTPSLSPLLVVVVLVLGTLSDAAPRTPSYGDDAGARAWPWLPGYMPSYYPSPSLLPSSGDDPLSSYGDYPDSSLRKSMEEDFNRRLLEVQRRCHEDFMFLRRLLEEQNHPMRGPTLDSPFYFPMYHFPNFPERGTHSEEEEEVKQKDRKKKPVKPEEEKSDGEEYTDEYPEYEEGGEDSSVLEGDLESLFLDSPTPGPEWDVIPLLPEVPDADDLPDKYDNSTSTVHILNGTRVEVNTTTHKDSGDIVTTFYHTEVINILPAESEEVEEEDTTEGPVLEGETEGEGDTEAPGVAGTDEETRNEDHPLVVPAELKDLFTEINPGKKATSESNTISDDSIRLAREVTESPDTPAPTSTGPQAQQMASYVKGGVTKGAGKESVAPPRDLSGDTLVNELPGTKKGGKKTEPDAEVISSEELL